MTRAAVLLLLVLLGACRDDGPHAAGGTGVVESVGWDLGPEIQARVLDIAAAEGDRVTKGQVLVTLDCAQPGALLAESKARLLVAEAQAQAAAAQVGASSRQGASVQASIDEGRQRASAVAEQQELSKREASRVESLGEYAPAVEKDQLQSRIERLDAELKAAQAGVRSTEFRAAAAQEQTRSLKAQATAADAQIAAAAAAVARAESVVASCTIVAPADAVVEEIYLEEGELARIAAPILRLARLDEVEVTFYLSNAELAAATPGRVARVAADAWPGQVFEGKVTTIAARAEFTPRNIQTRDDRTRLVYPVEVTVPNPEHRLRPGMPVEVTLVEGGSQ